MQSSMTGIWFRAIVGTACLMAGASTAHAQSEIAWLARYDGPQHGIDFASFLHVDRNGFAYVAGYSDRTPPIADVDPDADRDFVTIKYDRTGQPMWVQHYGTPANGYEAVNGLVVDDLGNVYIIGGASEGKSYYRDITTIKYSPNGELLWVARYDGTSGLDDVGYAITLDGEGGVIVTGSSFAPGIFEPQSDFITIKYDSEGGEVWVARFNNPTGGDDVPVAIAMDPEGNVLVTGTTSFLTGSLSKYRDFGTVKYDRNGRLQWDRYFDGPVHQADVPRAMAVDASGNVYVTGLSDAASPPGTTGGTNCLTISYSSRGDVLWAARYAGSAKKSDYTTCIALDAAGDVYVAGTVTTEKGIYPHPDYLVIKYGKSGVTKWVTRYGNHYGLYGGDDWANDIAVDRNGGVWVTGMSCDKSTTGHERATIRLDADYGALTWEHRYECAWSDSALGSAVAVDQAGNVYTTGYTDGTNANGADLDIVTMKLTPQFLPKGH
jgi:hypothetical protein